MGKQRLADKIKTVKPHVAPPVPSMSMADLAKLGGGKVAYVRTMTHSEAKELFPTVENLPRDIDLFTLHAADGTPLVLTDSRQSAIGHALGDDLQVAQVH